MDAKTLIDDALLYVFNAQSTDTLWNQYRTRALVRLQELFQGIWDYDAWDFKRAVVQLTARASFPTQTNSPLTTGVLNTPADFNIVGETGGVYVAGQHQKLKYLRPEIFMRKKEVFSEVSQFPYWYTIYGQNSQFTPNIFVYPVNTIDTLMDLFYEKIRPTIIDLVSFLPPTTAPTTALANVAGNLSVGAYTYVVTFVGTTATGAGGVSPSGETLPSPVSAPTLAVANPAAAGQVNLTNIPLGPSTGGFTTTARKIYRTVANGSQYLLVGTINDNVTVIFTDNIGDNSLGAAAPVSSSLMSGIEAIPLQYHEAVLLRGLHDMLAVDVGDARASADIKARAIAGAAMMKARRQEMAEDVWGLGDEGLNTWGMH